MPWSAAGKVSAQGVVWLTHPPSPPLQELFRVLHVESIDLWVETFT